uniref:Putative secreted protein n=1 Tax=Anopheles triannulatus TaxID=58253 RepID=A0A2M4B2B1_9DIPT
MRSASVVVSAYTVAARHPTASAAGDVTEGAALVMVGTVATVPVDEFCQTKHSPHRHRSAAHYRCKFRDHSRKDDDPIHRIHRHRHPPSCQGHQTRRKTSTTVDPVAAAAVVAADVEHRRLGQLWPPLKRS